MHYTVEEIKNNDTACDKNLIFEIDFATSHMLIIIIDKTEYNRVKLLMNFEKLKRSKIFNVKIDSTMRLIFRYSLFSSVLLLGLSQIVCADIRVPASIAAEKARRKPPANVSNYVLQSNSNGITLTWTNPTDSDFSKILILKNTSPIVNSPTRGRTYANGDSIGSSSVMYNAVRSSFTDTEITEGVAYFYKIFSYDTRLNYASGVELELDPIPQLIHIHHRMLPIMYFRVFQME